MAKRIFAMMLVLAMVLSLLPSVVVAEGAQEITASPKAGSHTAAGHADECSKHCNSSVSWTAWDGDAAKLAAGGHYYLTANTTLTQEVTVNADLHLCLNGFVLTAAENARVMSTKDKATVELTISDCTAYREGDTLYAGAIAGGNDTSATGGGALFVRCGSVINLYNIRLVNNASKTTGGALLLQATKDGLAGGQMTVTGCQIADNRAISGSTKKDGGAVRMGEDTVLTLKDTVFTNNSGAHGGAILATGGKLTIDGCSFIDNSGDRGGAIRADNAVMTVDDSTFTGNSGSRGGAIYTAGTTTLEISGSTFTENTATTAGAVMYMGGKSVLIRDSRFTGNTCKHTTAGGAVYMGSKTCQVTLSGNVYIADNTVAGGAADLVLYYADNDTIYVDGLSEGSRVVFSAPAATNPAAKDLVAVSGTQEAWSSDYLTFRDASGELKPVGRDETGFVFVSTPVVEPTTHSHCICGEESCTDHRQVEYQAWDGDVSKLAAGGKYYLSQDTQLSAEAVVTKDLDLCLNGHKLTAASGKRHFSTPENGNVTITISDCTAKTENGAYTAGSLTGGNSSANGGAILVQKTNKLYVYDGILTGNNTSAAGGAIHLNTGAEAYLLGGAIKNNTATGNGGAINTSAGSTLTLNGVTIQDNTSKRYGGAAYINSTAALTISGDTVVTGNKRNTTTNNLHLAGSSLMVLQDLGANASVGITAGERAITGETTDLSARFSADGEGYQILYQDGKLHYAVAAQHTHCECGKADCTEATHKKITYKAWTETTSLPASGSYYLTKDVTISKEVNLQEDLNLCLCGRKVTGGSGSGVRFFSTSGSNNEVLTITDCTAKLDNGVYTAGGFYNNTNTNTNSGGGAIFIRATGTLKFYEGIVSGCTSYTGGAAFYGKNAELYIYNAQVTDNKACANGNWKNGGAFYLANSNLTICNGQFTGNEAANGGAIYTTGTCTLDIRGGSFTGNTTHSNSGAIHASASCDLKISGDVQIIGNKLASGTASNLYLSNSGVMKLTNLSENAQIGVNATAFRAISTETQDYTKNVTSDNTKLTVVYRDNVLYTDAAGDHKHCLCGGSSAVGCDHTSVTYIEWDDPTSLPAVGNYYLSVDVAVANQTTVKNGTLNLCLNGHTIQVEQADSRIFYLDEGGTLNLSDCAGGGKLTGATKAAILTKSSGNHMQINLYGGNITGNRNATSGGGIVVQGDCEFNMYGGSLTNNSVESSLILDAEGKAVLDEEGNQTCNAANGGALYLGAGTVFNMYGGEISGNTAKEVDYLKTGNVKSYAGGSGGAMYIRGTANLYGGKITGNTAKLGGGALLYSKDAVLNVMGAEISGNTATSGGGLISQSSSVINLQSGTVSGNTATSTGGGIYVSTGTTLNMTGGTISGNIVANDGKLKNGAGIYLLAGTANISGGTISGHKAANGAAIFMCLSGTKYPTLNLSGDVLITGNTATAAGGAISATGEGTTITMTGGTISKNTAKNGGGVIIQTKSAFTMTGGKITGNTATSTGGGVYVSTSTTFTMTGGAIDANHATVGGGGVCLLRSTATFKGGSVSNNTSVDHAGIRVSGASVTIHNLNLVGNKATGKLNEEGVYTGGNGGGLFAGQLTYNAGSEKRIALPKITIYNIYAANNSANNAGGGMLVQSKGSEFTMHGGTFTNNTAKGSGGALYLSTNVVAKFTGGTFTGNNAKAAAAINFLGSQADISNVIFQKNIAQSQGGVCVIGRETADVTMKNVQMCDNECAGAAGALLLQGYAKLLVEDSKFTGNKCATSGGALYFGNPCYATFRNVEFSGNRSGGIGGAFHVHANADVTMDNVTITDNVAEGGYGGGISTRGRLVLTNSKVTNNQCLAGEGGGIGTFRANSQYLADDNGLFATNVVISGNASALQGGGVYGHRGGPVYLEGCTITDNTAKLEGGGIFSDGRFSLIDCTVTGNTSENSGYAVYMTAAEYDGHSYSTGFKKVGGNVIVRDNEGGELYIGEGTGVAVVGQAIGQDAYLDITLHSGVLSEHLFGVYHYEGGELKYIVTAGDRSVTDPEAYTYYQAPVEEEVPVTEEAPTPDDDTVADDSSNWLLYGGIGAGALAVIAAIVLLFAKKKKAGKSAKQANKE